ncbi:MAG TPA: hypothetical protein VM577_03630 [Anaerovoracaceae bacterium]|nr:hypothetical protein [Anaerovoracaceae bacterium]
MKNQYKLSDTEKKEFAVRIANAWLHDYKRKNGLLSSYVGTRYTEYAQKFDQITYWSSYLNPWLKEHCREVERITAVVVRGRKGGFKGIEVAYSSGVHEMLDEQVYIGKKPFNGDVTLSNY